MYCDEQARSPVDENTAVMLSGHSSARMQTDAQSITGQLPAAGGEPLTLCHTCAVHCVTRIKM